MASTPSASALSAVLRCQRNLLARKQANNKRTPASSGDWVRSSYFRPLWGFIFHGERVGIPGVLSITARLQTSSLGKSCVGDHLVKNTPKTNNKTLTAKVFTANQCSTTKRMSGYNVLSQNSLVLRLDSSYLRKQSVQICVVYSQRLNTIYMNTLLPRGLLCFVRDKLLYFTTAVSDCVRTKLDLNQLYPDCDNLSRCSSKHFEDKPKTLEGTKPEE